MSTYKDLGVVFDSSLNWKENLKYHHKESPLPSPLLEETEVFVMVDKIFYNCSFALLLLAVRLVGVFAGDWKRLSRKGVA